MFFLLEPNVSPNQRYFFQPIGTQIVSCLVWKHILLSLSLYTDSRSLCHLHLIEFSITGAERYSQSAAFQSLQKKGQNVEMNES